MAVVHDGPEGLIAREVDVPLPLHVALHAESAVDEVRGATQERCFSKTTTSAPPSAKVSAAARPAAPEPITTTSVIAGIVLISGRALYFARYFRMFFPAIRPEVKAKAEARPEEPLMG